ncbi:hypothetical protein ACFO3J_35820 [Streptomyces polygonati]|uniref:Uncharacterized protein n=1 Tax=Streptomyces polygonati TaxID=1617087 RepID=A0ABV8HXJ7_9ACTN
MAVLKPLSEELSPQSRALAQALRDVFATLGEDLRPYAGRMNYDPSVVSRYLGGSRLPPEDWIEQLYKVALAAGGDEAASPTLKELYALRMAVLAASNSFSYRLLLAEAERAAVEDELARLKEVLPHVQHPAVGLAPDTVPGAQHPEDPPLSADDSPASHEPSGGTHDGGADSCSGEGDDDGPDGSGPVLAAPPPGAAAAPAEQAAAIGALAGGFARVHAGYLAQSISTLRLVGGQENEIAGLLADAGRRTPALVIRALDGLRLTGLSADARTLLAYVSLRPVPEAAEVAVALGVSGRSDDLAVLLEHVSCREPSGVAHCAALLRTAARTGDGAFGAPTGRDGPLADFGTWHLLRLAGDRPPADLPALVAALRETDMGARGIKSLLSRVGLDGDPPSAVTVLRGLLDLDCGSEADILLNLLARRTTPIFTVDAVLAMHSLDLQDTALVLARRTARHEASARRRRALAEALESAYLRPEAEAVRAVASRRR